MSKLIKKSKHTLQKLVDGKWENVKGKYEISGDRFCWRIKMEDFDLRGNYRIKGKKGIIEFCEVVK